ncbi:MAG: DedA family protein [Brevinematales bacterium]
MEKIFSGVINWYMQHINYGTITLLMAIESSFIPFPSEVVVPPAAWKAASGELNIFLVVLFSTIGAIIGALVNYFLAVLLGRPLIYKLADTKIAHLLLIDRSGIEKAENYFLKYGKSSTFIGRLIPAIRQLISIPAGLAKMNMRDFLIFTFIGSGLWNIILALLGFFFYTQKELLERYYKELTYILIVLGILFFGYLIIKFILSERRKKEAK